MFHAARHALLTKAPPAACSFAHAAFASATLLAHVLSPTSLSPPSVFPSTIPIFAIRSSRDLAYPPISRQPRRSCDAREKPPVARRIHPNLAEKESQVVHAPAMRAATDGAPHERLQSADHYAVLGVACDFSAEEMRRAYRALSLRLHPDRGGDPAAFARVAAAHECLVDELGCRRGFHEGADLAEIGRVAKGGLVDELERWYFPARYPYQPFGK